MIPIRIVILFIVISVSSIIHPQILFADYSESCSRYARILYNAADEYESEKSNFESAKSSYESACDQYYGYSKDDEGACGVYGYERMSYESALDSFQRSKDELVDAIDSASSHCGTCDRYYGIMVQIKKEYDNKIELLNETIKKKDKEIEQLKEQLKLATTVDKK